MASFNDMAIIATRKEYVRRVKYCMKKAAIAIMAEDAGTANHTERVTYSKKILDGSASVPDYCEATVTSATLTTNGDLSAFPDFGISDNDLEFTVNSMINAMAGVATV